VEPARLRLRNRDGRPILDGTGRQAHAHPLPLTGPPEGQSHRLAAEGDGRRPRDRLERQIVYSLQDIARAQPGLLRRAADDETYDDRWGSGRELDAQATITLLLQ